MIVVANALFESAETGYGHLTYTERALIVERTFLCNTISTDELLILDKNAGVIEYQLVVQLQL